MESKSYFINLISVVCSIQYLIFSSIFFNSEDIWYQSQPIFLLETLKFPAQSQTSSNIFLCNFKIKVIDKNSFFLLRLSQIVRFDLQEWLQKVNLYLNHSCFLPNFNNIKTYYFLIKFNKLSFFLFFSSSLIAWSSKAIEWDTCPEGF